MGPAGELCQGTLLMWRRGVWSGLNKGILGLAGGGQWWACSDMVGVRACR